MWRHMDTTLLNPWQLFIWPKKYWTKGRNWSVKSDKAEEYNTLRCSKSANMAKSDWEPITSVTLKNCYRNLKFPAFLRKMFIIIFIKAFHWDLLRVISTQLTLSHPISLRYVLCMQIFQVASSIWILQLHFSWYKIWGSHGSVHEYSSLLWCAISASK